MTPLASTVTSRSTRGLHSECRPGRGVGKGLERRDGGDPLRRGHLPQVEDDLMGRIDDGDLGGARTAHFVCRPPACVSRATGLALVEIDEADTNAIVLRRPALRDALGRQEGLVLSVVHEQIDQAFVEPIVELQLSCGGQEPGIHPRRRHLRRRIPWDPGLAAVAPRREMGVIDEGQARGCRRIRLGFFGPGEGAIAPLVQAEQVAIETLRGGHAPRRERNHRWRLSNGPAAVVGAIPYENHTRVELVAVLGGNWLIRAAAAAGTEKTAWHRRGRSGGANRSRTRSRAAHCPRHAS